MRDPRERLRDMLEAIERIERYAGRGREEFDRDELIQNWVVHHLQILGEAARSLPEEVRRKAPDVEWNKITGMRHVLVHDYFGVDHDIVWSHRGEGVASTSGISQQAPAAALQRVVRGVRDSKDA